MASSSSRGFVMLCFIAVVVSTLSSTEAQVEEIPTRLEWPTETMSSLYEAMDEDDGGYGRRSLFWRTMHYYISYGALSANRIPCPPRSGRSYYTHNCFKARGPVHPYTRGCSRISRCRR